ncbi:MAG: hypothetical protein FJ125_14980 [Deltaproteobacteria bacterium]|nr:hypothetical protein [Deltaproteobacteria bacterium]
MSDAQPDCPDRQACPAPARPAAEELPEALARASTLCLSCHTCRLDCTVHVATGRLQPLRLVRLAVTGNLAALLRHPALWSCVQCNRCAATCPMQVAPAALVRRLRRQALASGAVPLETLERREVLAAGLQRVRWQMVARCLAGDDPAAFAADWPRWAEAPVGSGGQPAAAAAVVALPAVDAAAPGPGSGRQALDALCGHGGELAACMTCRECSTACPVAGDPAVFDPAAILRQVNLGLTEELLASPSIWLCLGCRSCSEACSQAVAGHLVVEGLQELALRQGRVPADLRQRLWAFEQAVYTRFLNEIERLLGG